MASLRGELDFLSASALRAHLADIRRRKRAGCVVDLTGVVFIDCACLAVLAWHCQQARAEGYGFALAGPRAAVLRILAVTGWLTWFDVHDTVGAAVAGAGRQRSSAAAPRMAAAEPGEAEPA